MRVLAGAAALLGTVGIVAIMSAQQSAPSLSQHDAEALYARVRARVLAGQTRLPNYTCVQTMTRTVSLSTAKSFRSCDAIVSDRARNVAPVERIAWERLRFDVALVDKKEVFSWAGASQFGDVGLHDLVGYGHTATGEFGPFLENIFSGKAPVAFIGERFLDGRRLLEFSYKMPLSQSNYEIKLGSTEYLVAFGGLILIDPATEEPVRLTIDSARLPAQTGYCMTENLLEYRSVQILGVEVLLPSQTTRNAINAQGDEFRNVTAYTACREYVGESALSFDEPGRHDNPDKLLGFGLNNGKSADVPAVSSPSAIPPGIRFSARVTTTIDSDRSAVGDSLEAMVRGGLYDKRGRTIAKSGTRLHGQITRFAMNSTGKASSFEIGVRFLGIDLPGHSTVPLRARLVGPGEPGGTDQGGGLFRFKGSKLTLRQLDANWITIPAEGAETQP